VVGTIAPKTVIYKPSRDVNDMAIVAGAFSLFRLSTKD
jgi:hypothetical protein